MGSNFGAHTRQESGLLTQKKMNVKFSKLGLEARGVKNKISRDVDIVLT